MVVRGNSSNQKQISQITITLKILLNPIAALDIKAQVYCFVQCYNYLDAFLLEEPPSNVLHLYNTDQYLKTF